MDEERANDREFTDMNERSEHQSLFDAEGHLSSNALNESIDGADSTREDELIRAHLAGCTVCSTRRNELAQTVALVRSLPDVVPSRSFEIAPQPPRESRVPATSRLQTLLTPAFPALRVAVVAVFLLLVGVTAADLITQPEDDQDQVAMLVADTPTAQTEAVMMDEAPAETQVVPAAPAGMEAGAPEAALPAGESSQAFDRASDDQASDAMQAVPAPGGEDFDSEATPATPSPSPSPTAPATESRVAGADDDNGLSNWRIAEIALLLLLFWLVVSWFGLERMRKR